MGEPTRPDDAPTGAVTWSVRDLAAAIGERLRSTFPDEIWVRGEIQNLSRPPSGHVYFTLVEPADEDGPGAELSVMLSSRHKDRVNRLLLRGGGRVRMTDGTEVRIRGRLDWYAPRGQLQLRMASIDPAFTLGQLAAARAALLDRLAEAGLVGANATRAMPAVPLRIGLVTSTGSAAEADVLDELSRSGYAFDVVVADVRVQGPEAPTSIAGAITWFARRSVDVVLVARGGGAATDLAAFDTEVVARAIAASVHPVVTGIGHEVDRSVADEVAHTAAKTPTAAAQHVVALVATAHARVEDHWSRIARHARHRLERADDELRSIRARTAAAAGAATRGELAKVDQAAGRLRRASSSALARAASRSDDHARRLRHRAGRGLDNADRVLDLLHARVAVADPARALRRGWSITRAGDGTLVRSVGDAPPGTTLHTTFADGTISSTVTSGPSKEHP